MFWWIAGFIWKAWCLAAGGGQIAEELLMWLQLPLESRCSRCPARANARAMAVHPLRPGGTGTHWPRTPASAYSWAEVGGRDCWGEEVAPQVFELSPSKPASQGSTGIRISKLFCWWIFCPQPDQPTLLYGAGGRFELLGLGQQPSLFSTQLLWLWTGWTDISAGPHCRCSAGHHAQSSFAEPWAGQEMEMGSCQHSPTGWGNQSCNGLWQQSVPCHALQGCRWFLARIFRGTWARKLSACPQGEPPFGAASPKPHVPRLAVVQCIWGLAEQSLVQPALTVVPCKAPQGGGICRVL